MEPSGPSGIIVMKARCANLAGKTGTAFVHKQPTAVARDFAVAVSTQENFVPLKRRYGLAQAVGAERLIRVAAVEGRNIGYGTTAEAAERFRKR